MANTKMLLLLENLSVFAFPLITHTLYSYQSLLQKIFKQSRIVSTWFCGTGYTKPNSHFEFRLSLNLALIVNDVFNCVLSILKNSTTTLPHPLTYLWINIYIFSAGVRTGGITEMARSQHFSKIAKYIKNL